MRAKANLAWVIASASTLTGALGFVLACSSSSADGDTVPTAAEQPLYPDCKLMKETSLDDSGASRSVVHAVLEESADGGTDGGSDGGSSIAPPSSDGGAEAATPPLTLRGTDVRTIACRGGTTLDVAAGEQGNVVVVGAGLRGELLTLAGTGKPETRKLDGLMTKGGSARVSVLEDGTPWIVGLLDTQKLGSSVGTEAFTPVDTNTYLGSLGNVASNAGGTRILSMSSEAAIVRKPGGEIAPLSLGQAMEDGNEGSMAVVGIDDEDRPYRAFTSGTARIQRGETLFQVPGIGNVRGAAFAPFGAGSMLPAYAVVRGQSSDTSLNAFEVALPRGESYARVVVEEPPVPCAADEMCSNRCTEENTEIEAKEIAVASEGDRVVVVFVRRQVTRERIYTKKQNSGVLCTIFGCKPYCTMSANARTKSAELVVADVNRNELSVEERFALPLEVGSGGMLSFGEISTSQALPLRAQLRDGVLVVSVLGEYQGSYDGVAIYRFAVQSP